MLRVIKMKNKLTFSISKETYSKLLSVKLYIIIISIIGFLYQTYVTTEEYVNYRTKAVTKTIYELQKFAEIPAITLCSDEFFNLEKLKSKFVDIESLIKDRSRYKRKGFDTRSANFRQIYQYLDEKIENFSFIKAFNESFDFEYHLNVCKVGNGSQPKHCKFDENSIDTFQDNMICETYFSRLTDNSINAPQYISSIGWIELLMKFNSSSDESNEHFSIDVSIHSPDIIPIYPDGFVRLKRRNLHILRYWAVKTYLLPTPYETDCHDYKFDPMFKSKDDCSLKCAILETRKVCKECIPNILSIRKDLLNSMDKLCTIEQLCDSNGFNNCTENFSCGYESMKDIYFKCNTKCRIECYRVEFGFSKIENVLYTLNESESEVYIEPKTGSRVTIKYIPSMTRTAFVANIGGIGGFWLGLNVVTVYQFSVSFGRLLYSKFKVQIH